MKKTMVSILLCLLLLTGCTGGGQPQTVDAPAGPVVIEAGDTPAESAALQNVTVTVRRNGQTAAETAVTSPADVSAAEAITLAYRLRSAAWPGVAVDGLTDCICLSYMQNGEQKRWYQFEVDGRPVLQEGEAGYYSILSEAEYASLLALAGLADGGEIGVDAATALLTARLGTEDAATGNTMSYAYTDTVTRGEKRYYRFRVSWLVDNDHLSYLGDWLVAVDGSEIVEATAEAATPAAYRAILEQYADAEANGYYASVDPDARDAAFGADVALEWRANPQSAVYALTDLDGDGADELLLAAGPAEGRTLYDLFCLDAEKAARPLAMDFGYRVTLSVLADGRLAVRWSNSAFESGCDYYRLAGAEAVLLASLAVTQAADDPAALRYLYDNEPVDEARYDRLTAEYEAVGERALTWLPVAES